MAIDSQHPEYAHNVAKWQLVRDVVNSEAKKYIEDIDKSDTARCARYKHDAILVNFTARTKNGLVGAVFNKDVLIELPSSVEYLKDDATGNHLSLVRLAQEEVGEVLQAGRYGLLVDYPASEEGLTAAQVANLSLKARISKYKAEDIINWHSSIINGQYVKALIVLHECHGALMEDGYTWEEVTQYRVLRMIDGVYTQELYTAEGDLIYQYTPRDFDGNTWEYIPFVFVGAEDNDEKVDASPLYDLAELNIGHLRNSADYEESVHVVGQPTMIIKTEMSMEQFKAANPDGVKIGSRRGLNLGINGDAKFIQADANQLADQAMLRKEQQAVMIGARLVMNAGANETAEAARIKHSGENSVLATIVHNVNDSIEQCIYWAMRFMSPSYDTDEYMFEISDDFFDVSIDPNMLMAQLQLYNAGIIAANDVRDTLRNTGTISSDRSNEDIAAESSNINPFL